jgi:hypothetical protein
MLVVRLGVASQRTDEEMGRESELKMFTWRLRGRGSRGTRKRILHSHAHTHTHAHMHMHNICMQEVIVMMVICSR